MRNQNADIRGCSKMIDISKVNRIEVIGKGGREYVKYFKSGEYHLQDDGKTLKIFVDS